MNRSRGWVVAAFWAGLAVVATAGVARAAEPEHVVTVTGHAEELAAPDRASVTLGVSAHAPTLEAARSAVNRVVPELLALTRQLGIAEAQVRSTRLSVYPDYNGRRVTGYGVQRQLIVDLRDIERLGELLEKSVSAGANVVGDPLLDSSRRADLERGALTHAVEDARRNAEVLAAALGASVGPPRRVTMTPAAGGYAVVARRMSMAGGVHLSSEAPETYQPGEMTFRADVEVSFDLLPGPAAH